MALYVYSNDIDVTIDNLSVTSGQKKMYLQLSVIYPVIKPKHGIWYEIKPDTIINRDVEEYDMHQKYDIN